MKRYVDNEAFLKGYWDLLDDDKSLVEHDKIKRYIDMEYMIKEWTEKEKERDRNQEKFKKQIRYWRTGAVIAIIGLVLTAIAKFY